MGVDLVKHLLETSAQLKYALIKRNLLQICEAGDIIINCLRAGGKILVCGNGGSAADAQHLAAELVGRFQKERPSLPALALTTNTSELTAISNDYGYERVFSRQVAALGNAGDVLIALSTSGRSPNVLAAVAEARKKRITCVGLTGENASQLEQFCDLIIDVPSTSVPRIQETHITILHIWCELIESTLFG